MLAAIVMSCVTVAWVTFVGLGAQTLVIDDQSDNPSAFSDYSQSDDRLASGFTLTDLNGNQVSLSRFRGRPVVINFWATWCPPCQAEIPHLIAAYEQEHGEVVFLAISVEESASTVRRFAKKNDMPFIILLDTDGEVASDYGVRGIPATFFVNSEGEIVVRYVGQMSPRVIEEGLRRIR